MLLRLKILTHPGKSTFLPSQKLTFLGFIKHVAECKRWEERENAEFINFYLEKEFLKISELASLIGIVTATIPENKLGPLCYRASDKCKTRALKKSKSNFECRVTL